MDTNKKPNSSISTLLDYSSQTSISNLISKFTVKIMYTGKNRNGTYFTKEIVEKMVGTIGGIPIVGEFNSSEGDFTDHGRVAVSVTEDGEIKTKMVGTMPYGFIPPDAKVWWERESDSEEEYLCAEAYLWTGRYEELLRLEAGKNNLSMELNPETMTGEWTEVGYTVTHAEFIGLCILGECVEPCFEDASIYSNFNFATELAKMKEELAALFALEEVASEEVVEDTIEVIEGTIEETEPTNEELEIIDCNPVEIIKDLENLELDEALVEDLDELFELKEQIRSLTSDLSAAQSTITELQEKVNFYLNKEKVEKNLQTLETFREDLLPEDYSAILKDIDQYSLEELQSTAERAAYKYMRFLRENSQSSNYSYDINEKGIVSDEAPEWAQAVIEEQRNKEA